MTCSAAATSLSVHPRARGATSARLGSVRTGLGSSPRSRPPPSTIARNPSAVSVHPRSRGAVCRTLNGTRRTVAGLRSLLLEVPVRLLLGPRDVLHLEPVLPPPAWRAAKFCGRDLHRGFGVQSEAHERPSVPGRARPLSRPALLVVPAPRAQLGVPVLAPLEAEPAPTARALPPALPLRSPHRPFSILGRLSSVARLEEPGFVSTLADSETYVPGQRSLHGLRCTGHRVLLGGRDRGLVADRVAVRSWRRRASAGRGGSPCTASWSVPLFPSLVSRICSNSFDQPHRLPPRPCRPRIGDTPLCRQADSLAVAHFVAAPVLRWQPDGYDLELGLLVRSPRRVPPVGFLSPTSSTRWTSRCISGLAGPPVSREWPRWTASSSFSLCARGDCLPGCGGVSRFLTVPLGPRDAVVAATPIVIEIPRPLQISSARSRIGRFPCRSKDWNTLVGSLPSCIALVWLIPSAASFALTRSMSRSVVDRSMVLLTLRSPCCAVSGSCSLVSADRPVGFIPARAGSTAEGKTQVRLGSVHPRSRAGRPGKFACALLSGGFIPARAGPSRTQAAGSMRGWVHPRARGATFFHGPRNPVITGSSPLVRGHLLDARPVNSAYAFFPACAGPTDVLSASMTSSWVHPLTRWSWVHLRARGDRALDPYDPLRAPRCPHLRRWVLPRDSAGLGLVVAVPLAFEPRLVILADIRQP